MSIPTAVESSSLGQTVYITYCSKEKRTDSGLLQAADRYLSERITRISQLAEQDNAHFIILSGSYGFLLPSDKIPFYDHLLVDSEVADIANLVNSQIAKYPIKPTTIHYFQVPDDPYVGPYRRVVELACGFNNISLVINSTSE